MPLSLLHLGDLHFGGVADVAQIEAVEALVPDLEPDVVVIAGDVTQRARHGEFQRARAFVRELTRSAPVYLLPGNHDVQWWWRPLLPFGATAKYAKYRQYFGPLLAPTLDLPAAIIAGVNTSHGVAWGSLTPRLRDVAVKGHLPAAEIRRASEILAQARPEQARVLVLHHNVLRGELSGRMGLARWRAAQRRIAASGAELVLCGHDHQEQVDTLDGVVVACTGTLSTRSRGDRPSVFFRVVIDDDAIHVEYYRWDRAPGVFRRSDRHQFARPPRGVEAPAPAAGD
ncbi:MAG: metallophosphoesterase [Gemmatimonadota bacterium]|nr:metallophosphoesterase [Gemmatimonadota bacterium]